MSENKFAEKKFHTCLMVFSKLPVIGSVKTRLIGKLSKQEAYELYCLLLEKTLKHFDQLALSKTLWIKGEPIEAIRELIAFDDEWQLYSQFGHNLGHKLAMAFEEMHEQYAKVLVIGGDCIAIEAAYIEEALSKLDSVPCVIGPAIDGGFVLVGFNVSHLSAYESNRKLFEHIFHDIDWGTACVYLELRRNLESLGIKSESLMPLWDIDRPEDLQYLKGYDGFEKFLS